MAAQVGVAVASVVAMHWVLRHLPNTFSIGPWNCMTLT